MHSASDLKQTGELFHFDTGLQMPFNVSKRLLLRFMAAAAAFVPATLSLPPLPPAEAAPEPVPPTPIPPAAHDGTLQIVVFEAPDCLYCNLFRRHVLPAYSASPRSRDVPLRFIGLEDAAVHQLGLDTVIDTLPTAVLLRGNREVGRIPGYVGPENFFHAVNHLLAQID